MSKLIAYSSSPDAAGRRRTAYILAAAAALVAYANTPLNDFCDDGIPIVAQNSLVTQPGHWGDLWTTDHWHDSRDAAPNRDLLYRPLALVTYKAVHHWAGEDAFPQLLINVLLHALLSAGVVRLGFHLGLTTPAALAAGLLFAVLPIHTEVIDNVVGRADLLAAAGVLVALLAQRRVLLACTTRRRLGASLVVALAVFAALSAKESGAAAIALVPLFYVYWRIRPVLPPPPDRSRLRSRLIPWMLLFSLAVPAVVYLGLRYHALEGHLIQKPALTKTINLLVDAPPWQRTLGSLQLWGMYWAKSLWPQTLSVNYSINAVRLATSPFDPHVLFGVAILVILGASVYYSWRRGQPLVALLVTAMLVSYAPTANALTLIQVFFAERNWYLPSLWMCLLAGWAVAPLFRRPAWVAVGVLALAACTVRCWARNAEWRDNLTLYAAAYRVHPQGVGALRLYGQTLVNEGRYPEGIALLRRAVEIDLGFTDAHRSLGHAYLLAGEYEGALRHLQIAHMQIPGHPRTEQALERAQEQVVAGQRAELDALRRRAREQPDEQDAVLNLVRRLRELGLLDETARVLDEHDARFAPSADWQLESAVTLLYRNDLDGAIARYERAIALDADRADAMIELAMLLLERRTGDDVARAWTLAESAGQRAPDLPAVWVCKAELAALKGDMAAAGAYYRRAIAALPAGDPQRRIWEQRARALGQ